MDSAQSFITSSWTFYLQADDGKIVIFQVLPFFKIEIKVSWLLTSPLLLPAREKTVEHHHKCLVFPSISLPFGPFLNLNLKEWSMS